MGNHVVSDTLLSWSCISVDFFVVVVCFFVFLNLIEILFQSKLWMRQKKILLCEDEPLAINVLSDSETMSMIIRLCLLWRS